MAKDYMFNNNLEISSFNGEGYLPLIDFESWRVAELRYCEELEADKLKAVSYTHLRAHETRHDLVCRLLLEKKKKTNK